LVNKDYQNLDRNLLTDTGGVWILGILVEVVPSRTHSCSTRDRGADRSATQAVSSTTWQSPWQQCRNDAINYGLLTLPADQKRQLLCLLLAQMFSIIKSIHF